jgi:FkbM family methyltransferase
MIDESLRWIFSLIPDAPKQRVKSRLGVPGMESTLVRMKRNGFRPSVVVDIGAYEGEFTTLAKAIFPDTRVLMVEPLEAKQGILSRMCSEDGTIELRQTLLGSRVQKSVQFHQNETASSVLREAGGSVGSSISLPMTTLDSLTAGTSYEAADFLKLDVQGYELEVLRGGERSLTSVEAVLMEVNLIEIHVGVPLIDEVVVFMGQRGFRMYDVCTFHRRPLDSALWQMDVVFVQATSRLLSSQQWG